MLATAERILDTADDTLIERAARGEVVAFDMLVSSRIDRCYRLAWSILANDADAADATQDAFVSAWRQLPRLRDRGSFDAWLNRIVANAARMTRRHRTRLREVSVAEPTAGADTSAAWDQVQEAKGRATEIDAVADGDAIGRAFDRLRPEERAILALHHVDERPVSEIARTLAIPVGTAKWRLHTARKALERAMEAEA